MLVTVITVAYNSAKTIRKTIEAVLGQTYSDIEYIIVDGASKDNTVRIAEEYREKFVAKGYKYVIVSEPDKGMYDALNKGTRLATGELVGQINSDDWYEPDAVANMVQLYEHENYDLAWGNILIHTPKLTFVKHARNGWLWTTTGWCHPAAFSRREVLLAHPYALESMSDDFEYATAVRQSGAKLVTFNKVISHFNFGGMSTQKSFSEVLRRVNLGYGIYRKHGMSKLYWVQKFAVEFAKYLLA